jgi:hypothetical protein
VRCVCFCGQGGPSPPTTRPWACLRSGMSPRPAPTRTLLLLLPLRPAVHCGRHRGRVPRRRRIERCLRAAGARTLLPTGEEETDRTTSVCRRSLDTAVSGGGNDNDNGRVRIGMAMEASGRCHARRTGEEFPGPPIGAPGPSRLTNSDF